MEKVMTWKMGRGEFLRVAVLLAGGTLLGIAFPRGMARGTEGSPARTDGEGVEGDPYARTVPGYPEEGDREGVRRDVLEPPREGDLPVRLLRDRPVPVRDQVRIRHGMAELL